MVHIAEIAVTLIVRHDQHHVRPDRLRNADPRLNKDDKK
jgi:hypothetical protein